MSTTSIIQKITRLNTQVAAWSTRLAAAHKKEVEKERQINALAKRLTTTKSLATSRSIQGQLANKQKELIKAKEEKVKIEKQVSQFKKQLFQEQDKLTKVQQQENDKSQKKELHFLKEKDRFNNRELTHFRLLNSELTYQQTLFQEYTVPQGEHTAKDEHYTLDELVKLHARIDEILEQLTKLGFGQEIIFDEIEDLKNKAQKISKKDLGLILIGQLVSYGSGLIENKLAAKIYQQVTDVVLQKAIE